MKTILLSAAAAFALAGPVFADTASDAISHFAQSEEGGDGAYRAGAATSSGDVAAAVGHFAQSEEGGDGRRFDMAAGSGIVVSTSNADGADFARAKLDNGERGDN